MQDISITGYCGGLAHRERIWEGVRQGMEKSVARALLAGSYSHSAAGRKAQEAGGGAQAQGKGREERKDKTQ